MVVNESALLKMMEKAYKGSGYHVISDCQNGDRFLIANYGYAWGVVIERLHMPWSVKGLIVKHTGIIPEGEEAFLVNKDDVQTEEFEVAAQPLLNILAKAGSVAPALKRTTLVFDGRNVWQRSNDKEVVLLNPDYEEIAALKNAQPFMVDECLSARGQHSHVFIGRIVPGEHEKDRVKHLSKILWT